MRALSRISASIVVMSSLAFLSFQAVDAQTISKSSASAFSQPESLAAAYADTKEHFSIRPPKGWKTDSSGLLGTLVAFSDSHPDSVGNHTFATNIIVMKSDMKGMSLRQLLIATINFEKNFYNGYNKISSKLISMNGKEVATIEMSFTQGTLKVHSLQIIYPSGTMAYAITGESLESTWQNHQALLGASMGTFSK